MFSIEHYTDDTTKPTIWVRYACLTFIMMNNMHFKIHIYPVDCVFRWRVEVELRSLELVSSSRFVCLCEATLAFHINIDIVQVLVPNIHCAI